MLFFYKPIVESHNIEKLDYYMVHFFENLFENEPVLIDSLIHPEFIEIYNAHRTLIKEKLKSIHRNYLLLSALEKFIIKKSFENNRQIENLCDGVVNPIKYEHIHISIREDLKSLLNNSWNLLINKHDDVNTKIKDKCGNIYEHYCELFRGRRQDFTICPVCGLEELLGETSVCYNINEDNVKRVREAYDHYFPKKIYPFISLSFSNLIPICHHCNSDYKHDYDTAYNDATTQRQMVFYPFSDIGGGSDISASIANAENIVELYNNDEWNIELSTRTEDINKIYSWNRLFLIDQRYKERIKLKEFVWLERLEDAVRNKPEDKNWDEYKIEIYKEINLSNQSGAIAQKAYYDYFFENLLEGYLEEVT